MKKVLVVGNMNLDILYKVPRLPEDHEKIGAEKMVVAAGGATANVAYWLASLGHDVHFASVIGSDPMSGFVLDRLSGAGVDTHQVRRSDEIGPNIMSVFTNGPQKRMVGGRTGNAAPLWETLIRELDFTGYDHVHFLARLYPGLCNLGRRDLLRQSVLSTDLNGQYSPDLISDFNICFTNHDEVSRAARSDMVAAMLARDLEGRMFQLIVTRGASDITCYRPEGQVRIVPEHVDIVDRTGGGDAFCAGYLHACWAGFDPTDAMGAGSKLAAAAFSGFGSWPDTSVSRSILADLRTLHTRGRQSPDRRTEERSPR